MIEVSSAQSAQHRERAAFVRSLAFAAICTAQLLLLVLAFVFFARSANGSHAATLPGGALLVVTLVLLAAGGAFRTVVIPRVMPEGTLSDERPMLAWQLALLTAPTFAWLLVLIPVTLAWQTAAWVILSWLIALGGEAASWLLFSRPLPVVSQASSSAPNAGNALSGRAESPSGVEPKAEPIATVDLVEQACREEALADDDEEGLAPDVTQKLTRTRDANGAETISALVRISFPAGEPQQVVHLAFCPPLEQVPRIELEQLAGPEIDLRTTVAQVFGTRFEARRVEPAGDEASAVVQLYASTASMDEASADEASECEAETEA